MSFSQNITGKYGSEKVTTSAQKQKLGARMQIFDREFVYVKAGEAITAGVLVDGMAGTTAHQVDLAVSAASAGATYTKMAGLSSMMLEKKGICTGSKVTLLYQVQLGACLRLMSLTGL